MIEYVRERLSGSWRHPALRPEDIGKARQVLDADILTLGFARRFTATNGPTCFSMTRNVSSGA
jgi:hypothetical protein